MKKVININFKGRVIPIEEAAFEQLQKYTESLRRYFANEEGRDEIINDIEDRIAELFDEELKKGATCITEAGVSSITASMGSVEDFEQMDNDGSTSSTNGHSNTSSSTSSAYAGSEETTRGSLSRNGNDKILGGVCSGLANYLKIDPTIVRILFAIITFGGFGTGVLIYIIMWIILPIRDLKTNVRKRLFRSPDDKVIGGVAGGLANYFNIPVWVPRVVFCLPLILGVITSIFRNAWFDFDFEPDFVFGGFGGTLFVTYIILWIVLPLASSATDKLQMRGEKIDVNSIKNAVQEELGGGTVKERAAQMTEEIKEGAQRMSSTITEGAQRVGAEISSKSKAFAVEAAPVARSAGAGIGHAIGVLFKAFFLFVAGVIAFALLMALIGVTIAGVATFPFKGFFLEGTSQHVAAWGTLLLFFLVPVIALLTWVIRKIIGTKSRNPYLGYTFGGLWVIGVVCLVFLIASFGNNFRVSAHEPQTVEIMQPAGGKMLVKVPSSKVKIYGRGGFNFDDVFTMDGDSLYINNIRLRIVKSTDSLYHVNYDKRSSGQSKEKAMANARSIQYSLSFKDSVLTLERGFTVSEHSKFRNQRVAVTIEVPVGKRIYIDKSVDRLEWHNVTFNGPRRGNWEWEDDWDSRGWNDTDVEYVMTEDGLERVDGKDKQQDIKNKERSIEEEMTELEKQKKELEQKEKDLKDQKKENDSLRYRYNPNQQKAPEKNTKQIVEKINTNSEAPFQPMTLNAL